MEEKNQPRRPRRAPEEQTRNESLVYGKNPVTELLKSGSGVDTVLISESMAPPWRPTIPHWPRRPGQPSSE